MKGRTKRETGGRNDAAADRDDKNQRYTFQSKVNDEAEEKKAGGRAGHKRGGAPKDCGPVAGDKSAKRADRMPRKSGGRANATESPFSSARSGSSAPGHKTQAEME